jgi:hypothetical protein
MGQFGLTGLARLERKGFMFFLYSFFMNTRVRIKSRRK